MAGWTGKRVNVSFSKPEDPSFLKKFKEKIGYKEGLGINAKFEKLPEASTEDLEDKDDELPQIVALNPGDLSEKDYNELKLNEKIDLLGDLEKREEGGKITFKKPQSKEKDRVSDLHASTKKRKKSEDPSLVKNKSSKTKKIYNKQLLSFEDDDE